MNNDIRDAVETLWSDIRTYVDPSTADDPTEFPYIDTATDRPTGYSVAEFERWAGESVRTVDLALRRGGEVAAADAVQVAVARFREALGFVDRYIDSKEFDYVRWIGVSSLTPSAPACPAGGAFDPDALIRAAGVEADKARDDGHPDAALWAGEVLALWCESLGLDAMTARKHVRTFLQRRQQPTDRATTITAAVYGWVCFEGWNQLCAVVPTLGTTHAQLLTALESIRTMEPTQTNDDEWWTLVEATEWVRKLRDDVKSDASKSAIVRAYTAGRIRTNGSGRALRLHKLETKGFFSDKLANPDDPNTAK